MKLLRRIRRGFQAVADQRARDRKARADAPAGGRQSKTIIVSRDANGLPMVDFAVLRTMSSEEATLPLKVGLGALAVAFFLGTALSWIFNEPVVLIIFGSALFMTIVAIAAADQEYWKNPKLCSMPISLWLERAGGKWVLMRAVEGKTVGALPYDETLSFVLSTFNQWFETVQQRQEKLEKHRSEADAPAIVTRGFDGEIVLVAYHLGPTAALASIQAALTTAFVTGYAANLRRMKELDAAASPRAASGTPPDEHDEKPSFL